MYGTGSVGERQREVDSHGGFDGFSLGKARDELAATVTAGLAERQGKPRSTTSSVFYDISQFPPIEDRVRAVSWIER